MFSGTQTVITDSISSSKFLLRDSSRGNGVITLNIKTGTTFSSAVDFTDADNYWNNVNTALDQAGTDCHWGLETTFDFYKNNFGRNSYNDLGSVMTAYVHYSYKYVNAFWDGTEMVFGDGDFSSYNPIVSLDVAGHELTHAVTGSTANLNYSYESGALNESFSDIMGTAIEFYGKPTKANWLIAEDCVKSGTPFRSMSNPKSYSQPNTYLKTNWYTGSSDNGGVHTNSGVQNYWFYLLAHGGSGTNDLGNSYYTTGIGLSDAQSIVYRNLTYYLTPSSQYSDSRFYSLQAASDLFGLCSNQYKQTAKSWYAVGVGTNYDSITKPLTGTYTIGGASPNYTNFTKAVADVMKKGVCGAVTFKVRKGVYNEQIRIGYIKGSRPGGLVTFVSEDLDSTKVTLTYASSSSSTKNYTLNFDSSNFVTFDKITITRTGSNTYANVVLLSHSASAISITNCILKGYYGNATTTTVDNQNAIISNDISYSQSIHVKNNIIKYGTIGIYLSGISNYFVSGNIFQNNIIDSFNKAGIYLSANRYPNILGNRITSNKFTTAQTLCYGIRIDSAYYGAIIGYNRIAITTTSGTTRGIYFYYSPSLNGAISYVYNNYIALNGGSSASTCIRYYYANNFYTLYNNTWNKTSLSAGTSITVEGSTSYINYLFGNNFVNTGGGYTIYDANASLINSLYNNFYFTSSTPFYSNGSSYSFSNWKTNTSFDTNSINVDPKYNTFNDLKATNPSLKDKCAYLGITDDIDGLSRKSPKTTIGANEFNVKVQNDAGIVGTNLSTSFCTSNKGVTANIKNFGLKKLTSATINWKINSSTQTALSWTNTGLLTDSTLKNVTLGSYTFSPGNYTLKIWTSIPNGASVDSVPSNDTFTQSIHVDSLPTPNKLTSTAICKNSATNIGGLSKKNYTYSWTSNPSGFTSTSSNPTATPTSKTTYYVKATNTSTGCIFTDSLTLTVNPLPTPNAGNDTTFCQGATITIGKKSSSGNSFKWNTGGNTDQISITPTKTAYYKLTETNPTTKCFASDSVLVTVNPLPTPNAGNDTSICLGNAVTIGRKSTSGNNFNWNTGATTAQITLTPTATGYYKLTETNPTSKCTASDSMKLTVNSLPSPNAGKDTSVCSGATAYLGITSTSGNAFKWSTGATTSKISVNPTSTTTYILTETISSTKCFKNDTVKVIVNPIPSPNAGNDTSICGSQSITLGKVSTSGNKFKWSTGDTTAQVKLTVSKTGYFNLKETNPKTGCFASDSMKVTVNSIPSPNAGRDSAICSGNSILIGTKSTSGNDFKWNNGATSDQTTVTPSIKTTYILTESNSSTKCTNSDTVVINVNPKPTPNAGNDTAICGTQTISLGKVSTSGNQFKWSTGDTTSKITSKIAKTGYYTLTETIKSSGCFAKDSVKVTVNTIPTPNAGKDTAICLGANLTIGVKSTSFNTFSWNTGASTNQILIKPTSTSTFWLKETNSTTGCNSTDTIQITVNSLPTPNAGIDTSICQGDSAKIGRSSTSGNNFSWSNGGKTNQIVVKPSKITNYILTETNPKTGCKNTDSILVSINPVPTPNVGKDTTLCAGTPINIGTYANSGSTYKWNNGANKASISIKPIITGYYTITETYTSTGCIGKDSLLIKVNALPINNLGADTSVCLGNSITIGNAYSKGYLNKWSTGATTSKLLVTPTTKTSYILTVTDSVTKCLKTDTIIVKDNPLPTPNAGKDTSVCKGDSLNLSVVNYHKNAQYVWSTLDTSQTIRVNPINSKWISLKETDRNTLCYGTDSVYILVRPKPITSFNAIILNNNGRFKINNFKSSNSYSWNFAGKSFSTTLDSFNYSFANTGTYMVKLTIKDNYCFVDTTANISILTSISIDNNNIGSSIKLYPNPLNNNPGVFTLDGLNNEYHQVIWMNLEGKIIETYLIKNQSKAVLSAPNTISSGTYIIKLLNNNGSVKNLLINYLNK